jgi:hypothetical protein
MPLAAALVSGSISSRLRREHLECQGVWFSACMKRQCLSTISAAASVPTPRAITQALASSSFAGAVQGSEDTKSFAHWLKANSADSDKEHNTAVTPRSPVSPNQGAVESKESRRKKMDEAPGSLLTSVVAQPQVLDPRSLKLAAPAVPASGAPVTKSVAEKPEQAMPSTAPPAAPVAFGVTIPKAAAVTAESSPSASVNRKAARSEDDKPVAGSDNKEDEATHSVSAMPLKEPSYTPGTQIDAHTSRLPETAAPASNSVSAKSGASPESKQVQSTAQAVPVENSDKGQLGDSSSGHKDSQSHRQNEKTEASSEVAAKTAALPDKRETGTPLETGANSQTGVTASPVHVPAADRAMSSVKSDATAAAATSVESVSDPQPSIPSVRPHSIDLRIGGTENSGVDVRVSQRAGDVQVTVRTPDTGLAQSLRDHLPELSDRLSQNGVHGDVWQSTPAQTSADTNSNQSDQSGADAWRGQGQGQQQQRQQQEQEQAGSQQQKQEQPSWLSELNMAQNGGV